MRLWHYDLIPLLPRQQLLGQHRECCALRGNGWKKSHSTVNYVFNYHIDALYQYHIKVMNEMEKRGYKVAPEWKHETYMGKSIGYSIEIYKSRKGQMGPYTEHNEDYYKECLENLKSKGIDIVKNN